MNKFLGHLKTVSKHKWWVFYYSCKAGIPLRGLAHDMSKLNPIEFFESVKYYTGTRSPIDACKEDKGYSMAWLHHKGRNKHHYEHWVDDLDNGGKPLLMPYKEAVEMLCDYIAAGRAYSGKDFTFEKELLWWKEKKKKPLMMHPAIKQFITISLTVASVLNDIPNEADLKDLYKECTKKYDKQL